jgi:Tol biopolymer transport system component
VLGFERVEERLLLSVSLVSVNAAGTASGNDASSFNDGDGSTPSATPGQPAPTLSADGSLMAFQSDATDLVAGVNDTNVMSDVFVRNLQTGQTQLVSGTPAGVTGNGQSFDPVISPDGRYVAFLSTATNLSSTTAAQPGNLAAPANFLYVRDLKTGTTTLLDATPTGQPSNGFATRSFVFSPNSSTLAFVDSSTNLTSPSSGSNAAGSDFNVYLRNLAAGTTSAVSITPGGALSQPPAGGESAVNSLVFSPDGTKLVFTSTATDLTSNPLGTTPPTVPGGGAAGANIYVSDLGTGATTLVSAAQNGDFPDGDSNTPVFSPDGTQLAFLSSSTDLTAQGTGGRPSASEIGTGALPVYDLFVRNLATGTTQAVSVNPGTNMLSTGDVAQMVFSPDGKSLAFVSMGADMTSNPIDPASPQPSNSGGPTFPTTNVFLGNLSTGTVTAVSHTPSGDLSNGTSLNPAFSPDGTSVAFLSTATDLTSNPAAPAKTASGSSSTDSYPVVNLFATTLATGKTTAITVSPGGTLSDGVISSFVYSPDGSQIAYSDTADDLTANPAPAASSSATLQSPVPGIGAHNIFVTTLAAPATTLISATPSGTLAADPNFVQDPVLFYSTDGKTLYFSTGDAILASDTNSVSDIYAATVSSGAGSSSPTSTSTTSPTSTMHNTNQGGSSTAATGSSATPQITAAGGTSTSSRTSASEGQVASTAVVHAAGPTVASVTLQQKGRNTTGLVINFNEPVASGSAVATGNYAVHLLAVGRTKQSVRAARLGKAIGIQSVQFTPNTSTVTLVFSTRVTASKPLQLRVRGGLGGITDRSGNALNSPPSGSPGSDYVTTLG